MTLIIDASSCIHFLAAGQQNILIQFAAKLNAKLAVSECVNEEIKRTLETRKFVRTGGLKRWNSMSSRVQLLSDELNRSSALHQALIDLHNSDSRANSSLNQRLTESRDLGEFLSVGHALKFAREGVTVIVVVDDRYGRKLVKNAQQILRIEGGSARNIRLADTRLLVETSEPQWRSRKDRAQTVTVAEVIADMERFGDTIPDWS